MPRTLTATRASVHGGCRLCGEQPAGIPHLAFQVQGVDAVSADFCCDERCQGYTGYVHGGIAAAICDAAMCNALFAQGISAYTAKLDLRYRRPLQLGRPAKVLARHQGTSGGAWRCSARIEQDALTVEATALFLPIPTPAATTGNP